MGRPVNRWGRPVLLAAALVAAALPAPAQERPDGGWLARGWPRCRQALGPLQSS